MEYEKGIGRLKTKKPVPGTPDRRPGETYRKRHTVAPAAEMPRAYMMQCSRERPFFMLEPGFISRTLPPTTK